MLEIISAQTPLLASKGILSILTFHLSQPFLGVRDLAEIFDVVLSRAIGKTIPELDVVLLVLIHLILNPLTSSPEFLSEWTSCSHIASAKFCENVSNVAAIGDWFKVIREHSD